MPTDFSNRDKKSLLKVLSDICGNLSAGWFGLVLIAPGLSQKITLNDFFTLTQSALFGILFLWLAFILDRKSWKT